MRTIAPLSNVGRLAAAGSATNAAGLTAGASRRPERTAGRDGFGRIPPPTDEVCGAALASATLGAAADAMFPAAFEAVGGASVTTCGGPGTTCRLRHVAPAPAAIASAAAMPIHRARVAPEPGRPGGDAVKRRPAAAAPCWPRLPDSSLRQHLREGTELVRRGHARHLFPGVPAPSARNFAASNARPRWSLERTVPTAHSRATAASA